MPEKQKKCPEGQVSLHLNRKLFRRLPLDFHGKITLIDSPSAKAAQRPSLGSSIYDIDRTFCWKFFDIYHNINKMLKVHASRLYFSLLLNKGMFSVFEILL